MKKFCKSSIIFFISLIVFLNLFTIPVQAVEDGGFNINSANYDVVFMENGDVKVIEHWYLDYFDAGNTFNERFISKYSKSLAKRTTLEDVRVYVGENICDETKSNEYQEDYTYNIKENEKGYRISVFMNSKENDKRQITLVYTLKNLIKSVDNEYYYINFDATPYSILKEIDVLTLTFRLHNDERIEIEEEPIIFPVFAAPSRVGNNIQIKVRELEETKLTTILKIKNNCFNIPPEAVISKKDVPFKPRHIDLFLMSTLVYFLISIIIIKLKGRSLKIHMPFKRVATSIIILFLISIASQSLIVIGGVLLWYIFMIFSGFKQEDMLNKHEENIKELQHDPTMIKDIIMKYRNNVDYKDLLDSSCMFPHLSFVARLVDAHQKNLLNLSENGTVIFSFKKEYKNETIFKILRNIEEYCKQKHIEYSTNGDKITFTFEIFKKYFENPNNYGFVFSVFHFLKENVYNEYYKQEKDKKLRKEFEKDCFALISLSEVLNKENMSFEEFLNTPISIDTYISFLQNNLETKPTGNRYNKVDLYMYEIYKKHIEICTKKKRNPITGERLNSGD